MAHHKDDFLFLYATRGIAKEMSEQHREALAYMFLTIPENFEDGFSKALLDEVMLWKPNAKETLREKRVMVLASAMDYAMPRMSTAGDTVRDAVRELLHDMTDEQRQLLQEKISSAAAEGRLGDTLDEREWLALRDELEMAPAFQL